MSRVTTNSLALIAARESSLGILPGPPVWRQVEPNSINSFGPTIGKTVRNPISQSRQRRKGIITDLDSSVEFDADLTLATFRDYMEGFCFSQAVGPDVHIPSAATSGAFTVPAVSAAQAGRLKYGATAAKSLLYTRGFGLAANNGLFVLAGTVATSATSITVTGGAVAETPASTRDVELAIAGIRGYTGDLEIDSDGNLTSTALDFTTLGLYVGQWIHIGGVDVANRFFQTENYGFARISVIAANKITLECREQAFTTHDGTDTGRRLRGEGKRCRAGHLRGPEAPGQLVLLPGERQLLEPVSGLQPAEHQVPARPRGGPPAGAGGLSGALGGGYRGPQVRQHHIRVQQFH